MTDGIQTPAPFDFAGHAQRAAAEYLKRQAFYRDLAFAVSRILEECLQARDIKVQTVQHRAKSAASLTEKAATPSEDNPNAPRYSDPLRQITDLAGVRIITYFPATLDEIDALLASEFEIVERSDKSEALLAEEKFGYQSVHYLVRLRAERASLAEYKRHAGVIVEVQVRTVLQHAWAEIEHDIQYKSANAIPVEIRRRFMALAGMLEIADREFQAIGDANRALESHAEERLEQGDAAGLEITPNSLKLFLNNRLGPDGRISDWTYDWTTRLLKQLGFRDLKQVETAVAQYDDNQLSQIAEGNRQGQTTRFELMLLAAMGEPFIQRNRLSQYDWFQSRQREHLKKMRDAGIPTATYDPDQEAIKSGAMVDGWPDKIREAQDMPKIVLNGQEWTRLTYGEEQLDYGSNHQPCHDCGALKGQYHVDGCDVEECPACHEQAIGCGCNLAEGEVALKLRSKAGDV